jgi:hypothetical protein
MVRQKDGAASKRIGYPMPEDWNAHRQALTETQAWCALKLDVAEPATSLRSAALRPAGYPGRWDYGKMMPGEVANVIERRRTALGPITEPPGQGRILCVISQTDTQTTEGAPASDGVIDESCLPPWDVWFAILPLQSENHLLLLAWIPAPLVGLVGWAAEISPTQTITWLDEGFPPSWAEEGPHWYWKDTTWGQLPAEDLGTIEQARRELCRAGPRPLTA